VQNTVPDDDVQMDLLAREVRLRAKGDAIVFVSGNFNVLHTGHLRLLRFASSLGGRLVVGVLPDGQEGATIRQATRIRDVKAIGAVHEVVALREPAESFIFRLRPDTVVKGREYQDVYNIEQEIVSSYGGKLIFSSGEARLYSSELMSPDLGRGTTPEIAKTLKQRFRASGKTLLRVNHLRQGSINPDLQARLNKMGAAALETADILLFSDFNYGCLPQPVVDHLSARARDLGILMAADSQASSQMSDVSRFRGMSLITPTEHEARLAMRDEEAGLIMIADRLQRAADAENVVVTLGGEGVLIFSPGGGAHHTDRLPAFNRSPRDVAGAGDSFFTCTAMALRVGADIWQAAYLGSLAAAWQVSHVGNTPMPAAELLREVSQPLVRMHESRP